MPKVFVGATGVPAVYVPDSVTVRPDQTVPREEPPCEPCQYTNSFVL